MHFYNQFFLSRFFSDISLSICVLNEPKKKLKLTTIANSIEFKVKIVFCFQKIYPGRKKNIEIQNKEGKKNFSPFNFLVVQNKNAFPLMDHNK